LHLLSGFAKIKHDLISVKLETGIKRLAVFGNEAFDLGRRAVREDLSCVCYGHRSLAYKASNAEFAALLVAHTAISVATLDNALAAYGASADKISVKARVGVCFYRILLVLEHLGYFLAGKSNRVGNLNIVFIYLFFHTKFHILLLF